MANLLQFPAIPATETQKTAPSQTLPDETERLLALDTEASWIVEAPAGSGKTGLLMQRYLKLLAAHDVMQPEEVLAITFTRKATAELRSRILEQLEAAQAGKPLDLETGPFERATREFAESVLVRDRQLGWGLLDNPGKLRIRTIDSLCSEIAGTLPLLSGTGGNRKPVEEALALYRVAARRTLMQLGGYDRELHNALHTVLLHRDGNLNDCEKLLADMLQTREQWAELVPLDRESLADEVLETEVRPKLESALESIVCAGLTRALDALPSAVLYELTALATRLSGEPGYQGQPSPLAICSGLHVPPDARGEHLDHWTALINLVLTKEGEWRKSFAVNHVKFAVPKAEKTLLENLVASLTDERIREALCAVRALPPARYPDDQWHVAKALFRLLLHALAELKVLFAERGECDFVELALAAREALESESGALDLANSSGVNLKHLLVDEMQDTSSAQYRLLELLTRSWDGHSQTLFLVGDPKQSIYLFRQARVERFLRTMFDQQLGDVPLRPLRLTSNFRSQQQLVDSFNGAFSRIFPSLKEHHRQSIDMGDVPFVNADGVRKPTLSEAEVWHTAVGEKGDDEISGLRARRDHTLAEGREIRRIIEEWRSRPLPPGRSEPWKIAVLARARKHLAHIVTELQRCDEARTAIPFRAVNVEALGERQEVLDALALTRALLHPADRVAWLAVLHAPWCGLGLADLLALTGEGAVVSADTVRAVTVSSLVVTRSHHLSVEGQQLLARAWPLLKAAQAEIGRGDVAVLVERTWRSLGGDVILTPEQVTNVQRYFTLLHKVQEPGSRVNLRALATQLTRLFAEPSAVEDAVDLMTIHSAKGLEWDVVLIPSLEKRGQTTSSPLLNWLELDTCNEVCASVVLAPIQRKGEQSSDLSSWLRSMSGAREKAELKRLFYVACTRAREALHLFARCERTSKGELKPASGTLLETAWPAAASHFGDRSPAKEQFPNRSTESLSHDDLDAEADTLALAAAAEPEADHRYPVLQRLPIGYDPVRRFTEAAKTRIPYPQSPPFDPEAFPERPEGSFAVRAFGNVVHRFLQLMSDRLAAGLDAGMLQRELLDWHPRILASFRAEGLSLPLSTREATRALASLTAAITDEVGRWILSPHPRAASESTLTVATAGQFSSLRVDRTFVAGNEPLSSGESNLWIIDFKTTEQGSREPEAFAQDERMKYGPQLERYAASLRTADGGEKPITVGLYYPSVPRLIHWQYVGPLAEK